MLEGKKTFIGIALMILSAVGYGDIISGEEVSTLINNLSGVIGTIVAVYGRLVAKKTFK